MTFALWTTLILEALKPVEWSWVVIILPILAMLVAISVCRGRRLGRNDGVWRHMGWGWLGVGLTSVVAALVTYVAVASVSFFTPKYDTLFQSRLEARIQGLSSIQAKKQMIRRLAEMLDVQALRDIATDFANKVPAQSRHDLLAAILGSKVDQETIYTSLLINREQKSDDGNPLMINSTDLMLDEKQRTLHDANQWSEYYAALRPTQWKYLSTQFFRHQRLESMTDILANFTDFLPAEEIEPLMKSLLLSNYAGTSSYAAAHRIAWEAGEPSAASIINFFLEYIRWLRDSLWALLYVVIGLLIVRQGHMMKASPPLFRDCRKSSDGSL